MTQTNLVNERDVDANEFGQKQLAAAAGSRKLGCTHLTLGPGETSGPYHYHTANEEALYVLSGGAVLRTPDGETRVGAGDYVAFHADESGAHAISNDADEPFRALFVSTMNEPDIVVYPDSGVVGLWAGAAPGNRSEGMTLSKIVDLDAEANYPGAAKRR
ncbi:cupin domain-containing protein [Haloferacaceae archaeon DSL9]